jgi:hypothetical protein
MTLDEAIAAEEVARTRCREARDAYRSVMASEDAARNTFYLAERALAAAEASRVAILAARPGNLRLPRKP